MAFRHQGLNAAGVATELGIWLRSHPEFDGGTNEAGIRLGDDTRLTRDGQSRHGMGDHLPPHPALPGLTPAVADLFRQISR